MSRARWLSATAGARRAHARFGAEVQRPEVNADRLIANCVLAASHSGNGATGCTNGHGGGLQRCHAPRSQQGSSSSKQAAGWSGCAAACCLGKLLRVTLWLAHSDRANTQQRAKHKSGSSGSSAGRRSAADQPIGGECGGQEAFGCRPLAKCFQAADRDSRAGSVIAAAGRTPLAARNCSHPAAGMPVSAAYYVRLAYLLAYNAAMMLGWTWVLSSAGRAVALGADTWEATSSVVQWLQTLALLEILHAALGWVRASVAATAVQVLGRLFFLWGVAWHARDARSGVGLPLMFIR